MSGKRFIFDKVATSGKAVPHSGEDLSNKLMVANFHNKGKWVAEGEIGNVRLKKPATRLVIKRPSTQVSIDKVVREKEAEPSKSSTEEQDERNDIPLPKTPGGSLSPSSFGGNISVPPSSPESSERVIYDTPEIQRSQNSDCDTNTAQENQPSSDGSSVNTDKVFRGMSGNDETDNQEVGTSAQGIVGGEDGVRTEFGAETVVAATDNQMNKEVDPPAGRGEVGGRSGISLGLEPLDLKTQRIRRYLNFLRFCLENLSGVDPHEFAAEAPPILGCLDLLWEEGVDVNAISQLVEELFDSGRQYESIVVCSARELRVQEIQSLLASLEESIRTKSLERESLQAEDVAAASLMSEVESLKQEMEVLRSRLQEKEALLNPKKAEAHAA